MPMTVAMSVASFSGSCSFLDSLLGPRQCIVGDLLPPLLGRHEMRASRKFLDLRDRVRLVVLRVRALDGGGHQVILAPRDEEKGSTGVVVIVDRDVLRPGDEVRQ